MRRALAVIAVALLAGCGASDPPAGMKVEGLTVKSQAVGQDMKVKVVVPQGGAEGKPFQPGDKAFAQALELRRCNR